MRSYFQFLLFAAGLCGVAQAQTPMITSLSPPSVAAGSAQFTLKVLGANFPAQAGCYVTWSDSVRSNTILTTTWISTTEVDATVPAGYVTVVETASVGVSCGLVQSNPVTLAVTGSTSTITINTCAALPQGTTGTPYNISLAASGGTQPYLWSAITALPPGLSLNNTSGVLSGTPNTALQYAFMIQVSDSSSPQLTAQQTFSLTIGTQSGGTPTISICSLPVAMAGQPYTTTLTAAGGTPPYTWSQTGFPSWLTLTRATGLLGGTPPAAGTYMITVQVSDSASHTSSKSFSLSVTMSSTSLSITTSSPLPAGVVGVAYPSTTLAVSGGVGPYTWVIFSGNLPPGLNLDQNAGSITGTPQTAGTFSFTLQVADSTGLDATATFSLTVTATAVTPLTISTASPLPAGMAGAAYPSTTLAAMGGTAPYTWALSGNTDGLSLDPSGVISGTPQTAGTFNFTVQVTDSTGKTGSKAFALTISAPAVSLTITTVDSSSGTVGVAFSQRYTVAGGTAPYTWTVMSGTVPGLTLSPTTPTSSPAMLSGTPTQQGTFTITVKVTDASQAVGTRTFTIAVAPGPLRITTSSQLPAGTLGTAYTFQMAAVGGTPPYTWSATGLPAGLAISSSGLITGTVGTAGALTLVVMVTDSAQPPATARSNFQINVTPPGLPVVTISGLPATAAPLMQYSVTVAVASAYPVDITGTAVLSSSPSDSGPTDGSIQFSGGGKSASFKVNAGTTSTTLAIQTGSVAGTVTLTLSQLSAGGTDVTPTPAPSAKTQMAGAAPVITAASVSRSGSTLTVEITGYATSREITQAVFAFTAAMGQTLQTGASSITIPLSSLFSPYFQNSQYASFGSQFVFSQPFTIQGDINSVVPTNVTLTNRVGSTTSAVH